MYFSIIEEAWSILVKYIGEEKAGGSSHGGGDDILSDTECV
jgi:hypothetical protein